MEKRWRSLACDSHDSNNLKGCDLAAVREKILYCKMLLLKEVTVPALLALTTEILSNGALPVGEIGKMLQDITSNPSLSHVLKTSFGGLKRFLQRYEWKPQSAGGNENGVERRVSLMGRKRLYTLAQCTPYSHRIRFSFLIATALRHRTRPSIQPACLPKKAPYGGESHTNILWECGSNTTGESMRPFSLSAAAAAAIP